MKAFLAVSLLLLSTPAFAGQYPTIEAYIVDQYKDRGEDAATAACLARSMVLAIPADDKAKLLQGLNAGDGGALAEKWLPIGNEKVRPEINETMYGYCGLEWSNYVQKGTLR